MNSPGSCLLDSVVSVSPWLNRPKAGDCSRGSTAKHCARMTRRSRPAPWAGAVLLSAAASSPGLFGQSAPTPTPAPAVPLLANPTMGTPALSPDFAPVMPLPAGFSEETLGRWLHWAHLRVNYSHSYSDGGLVSPGETESTITQTLSPGITILLGDRWSLSYTPSFVFYSSDRYEDGIDHRIALDGRFDWAGWYFGFGQGYALSSSQTLVETARQTDQQSFTTRLSAGRGLSSKVSVDLGIDQSIRLAADYTDVYEWSTMNWLNYQAAPRLSYGPGIGFGYTRTTPGTDMTFEQFEGRVSWHATDKVDMTVHGGVEDRQMLGSGLSDLVSPLFGASVQWRPFEVTTVSFHVDHSINASYFDDQVTESTTLGGSLSQRLLKKLMLSVSGGYRTGEYVASAPGVADTRKDDTVYVSVRLSTRFLRAGTIGAFYSYSENLSNADDYAYSDNRMGFDVGYGW